MILQVTETVKKSLIVNTPSFYKYGSSFLKIVEDKALMVDAPGSYIQPNVRIITPDCSGGLYTLFIEKGEEVEADVFNEALCAAQNEFATIHLELKIA